VLAVGLLLAPAGVAHGADVVVSTPVFSPKARGRVAVTVTLPSPQRVGLELVGPRGAVGWLAKPQKRRYLKLRWNGAVAGRRVRDGRYRLRLVAPKRHRVLATKKLEIDSRAPQLTRLRVTTPSRRPFAGDRRLLATISPNGDGLRDSAKIGFVLTEPAHVRFVITRTASAPTPVHTLEADLQAGPQTFTWYPPKDIAPRTYLVLLEAEDAAGNVRELGATNAETGRVQTSPVVRVLGVDAAFSRESYAPGEQAELRVETDAPSLELQLFRSGPEDAPVYSDITMSGVPVTEAAAIDWTGKRGSAATIPVGIGDWASGVYFARLTAPDGRVGFAPFVLRPSELGEAERVAVVLPTNTWQGYNFRDEDGNGWGDTWYVKGAQSTAQLGRPFLKRGVPPQFRKYDLGFLRWLHQRGRRPDYLSETDLEVLDSAETLAQFYDLVVFSGHSEYVTRREYDLIQGFRDLGGNLVFLSANNFFWEVRREGSLLRRTRKWRDQGRPEAALIGTQYLANDNGRIQRPYVVQGAYAVPWLFQGTGIVDGSSFGPLGGYGIEIDATTPDSPPGTMIVAAVPEIYGPGFTAQMTYYETPAGAKVFAAGTLDFGGTALEQPVATMLENLWSHLSAP
jgi:hypothetical protein